ncbi:MAG TPA: response regulator transcription factor [Brachybacterium massiliense]|uniref:Response regulator transcription factor n=1 Tax=Brachybacterium massiliense TaxID=1755098 RepID=A0A921SYB4_9MICO|nr:response regulator transcription factor [Brachybacterium massiliense]
MTETATPARPIRVLLVDDQDLVRYGLRLVLEAQPDIEVVAEASDGADALRAARGHAPDVVLMDVRMPGMDGIEATRQLTAAHPKTRVLVLTTYDLDEFAFGALQAGAAGFLLKNTRPDELVGAVRSVVTGDAVVSPRVTAKLIEVAVPHLSGRGVEAEEALAVLSEREREVFVLVGRGFTNTEIAQALQVSESTVKAHFGRILTKMDLPNRVQAVIRAYELGVVGAGR